MCLLNYFIKPKFFVRFLNKNLCENRSEVKMNVKVCFVINKKESILWKINEIGQKNCDFIKEKLCMIFKKSYPLK